MIYNIYICIYIFIYIYIYITLSSAKYIIKTQYLSKINDISNFLNLLPMVANKKCRKVYTTGIITR